MLVFGDAVRTVAPDDELARLLGRVGRLDGIDGGRAGEATTDVFIDAAELMQGLVDARFEERGEDDDDPEAAAAMDLMMVLAEALVSPGGEGVLHARLDEAVARLRAFRLPPEVRCKRAEGHAFYALYPESFAAAARVLQGRQGLQVVGLRSIGLGLAAMVATGAGAAGRPVSLRPVGHPFERRLSLSARLRARLLASPGDIAVVDEGPGLSGSSIGAVLDTLEAGGIARSRVHVFPGHSGDLGPHASAEHRRRWGEIRRHVVDFERSVLQPPDPRKRLETWFADLTGLAISPLQNLSGGAWRALRFPDEALWPAANVQMERRKYLLRSEGGCWLLKFAGLGRYGAAKLKWAAPLAEAGFIPRVEGLRNGFLIERWMEDAAMLASRDLDRTALVRHLAAYLGFRARHFAAGQEEGASLPALAQMLRCNAKEGLGNGEGVGSSSALARFCGQAAGLQAKVRRVATDNRLRRCEWLRQPDGRILKTDALDHAVTHDLVGCQDIAWDIAGATAEFDLSDAEKASLVRRIELASGHGIDADLLRFLVPCYLAFELGSASMARDSLAGLPAEARRMGAEAERYRRRLAAELGRML